MGSFYKCWLLCGVLFVSLLCVGVVQVVFVFVDVWDYFGLGGGYECFFVVEW